MTDKKKLYGLETQLGHAGRNPAAHDGIVNPPIYHASTMLYDSLADYRLPTKNKYGRRGTETTRALEAAAATLEGCDRAVPYPSGLAAVAGAITAVVGAGDHLLIGDNVYAPTRNFCKLELSRFGVEVEHYDPALGGDIRKLFRPNTKAVYMESPGSGTFDVVDVPAICAAAHEANLVTILDNTWSAGFYFKPFEHGVDISIQAATKYFTGHADCMLGFVLSNEDMDSKIRTTAYRFGTCVGPDVCYMGLRGVRTLGVRMPRHYENGLKLAEWLSCRPEVEKILHPAMPSCPGHEFWKRDYTGASGLFGVVLKPASMDALAAMIDDLQLYGLGDSWGGYESLLVLTNPKGVRTATDWPYDGPCIRIHAGLEDVDDLIEDLADGLDRLTRAS